jgi:GAF domain-containing protein
MCNAPNPRGAPERLPRAVEGGEQAVTSRISTGRAVASARCVAGHLPGRRSLIGLPLPLAVGPAVSGVARGDGQNDGETVSPPAGAFPRTLTIQPRPPGPAGHSGGAPLWLYRSSGEWRGETGAEGRDLRANALTRPWGATAASISEECRAWRPRSDVDARSPTRSRRSRNRTQRGTLTSSCLRATSHQGSALTGASRAAVAINNDAERAFEAVGDVDVLAQTPDPRSGTLLAVPITVRSARWATLVVADKPDGSDFTTDDKELVTLLNAQASVAIENARRYESVKRWLRQLEALTEVDKALARGLELSRLLPLVAAKLRELIGAGIVLMELPTERGDLAIRCADGEEAAELVGIRLPTQRIEERIRLRTSSERAS